MVSVADLAIGDYLHDGLNLFCVIDAERLRSGRFLIRLENCKPSFIADHGEPFYDVRNFNQEDVEAMTIVERTAVAA